jgi:hypothetical protein
MSNLNIFQMKAYFHTPKTKKNKIGKMSILGILIRIYEMTKIY